MKTKSLFIVVTVRPLATSAVPEPERIATFDNDGIPWTERPVDFQ